VAKENGCPNRPDTWNVYKRTDRIRIGYFIQVSRDYATLSSTAGIDGRLGHTWEPWEAPMRLGKTNDKVMVSDIDEYLLNAGFTGGPGDWTDVGQATTVSHGPYGYIMGPLNVPMEPTTLGSEGGVWWASRTAQFTGGEPQRPNRIGPIVAKTVRPVGGKRRSKAALLFRLPLLRSIRVAAQRNGRVAV
jgi:hypothetical protein